MTLSHEDSEENPKGDKTGFNRLPLPGMNSGSGSRPIGSDPCLMGRVRSAKWVCAWQVGWAAAVGLLGHNWAGGGFQLTRLWDKRKPFTFFKTFL
jgi:hypothetical protein